MSNGASPQESLFGARLRLARAALLLERAWPACWPALVVLVIWLVLALFDVLPSLPGPLHIAVLVGLAVMLGVAIVIARRAITIPGFDEARRRVERVSGLEHRPLLALADRPSGFPDAQAMRLWQAHRRRMLLAARHLRAGFPAAGLARRDPWGLRSVLTILLVLGVIDAGADWRDRLVRSATPNLALGPPAPAASLNLWITPPDYTGLPPQFLKAGTKELVRVPVGSALLAQVHGGGSAPRLAVDEQQHDFDAVDKQNFRISATLTSGKRLAVSQGGSTLGSWPIAIVPDMPPAIAFAKPPEGTARGALRIDYRATDDYGVEAVKLVIRRQGGKPDDTVEVPLQLPGLHLKNAQATSYNDLTPHPWAGLPVEMRLLATDAIGQTGESEPVRMVLPERTFNHPVARAIIDQRKELVKDPASRIPVAEILGDLRERPQLYRDDTIVFLGLRVAEERLRLNGDPRAVDEVVQLLWDTALRIEEGSTAFAEREMRRLQQELQDALAKGAPDAEIDRLIRELQQAIDRYLQSMAEQMARDPNQEMRPVDPSRMLSSRDLQRMLDEARALARSGERDKARELLSQLQNMLENLRMAQPGQMSPSGSQQAEQMLRGLRDMMHRQQQLLDRSFRAQRQMGQPGQQGQPGQPGQPGSQGRMGQQRGQPGGDQDSAGDLGDAAGQQDALRHMLGEMMRRLGDQMGDIPDPFGHAERAMRDATEALKRRQPGEAIDPQTEALDQLQQAARDFAQQLQRRMGNLGNGDNRREGDGQGRERAERDPLGRPLSNSGNYDQGDVKIPDQNTLQKARDILDELRRRAGERYRPELELDYIERLLKRF